MRGRRLAQCADHRAPAPGARSAPPGSGGASPPPPAVPVEQAVGVGVQQQDLASQTLEACVRSLVSERSIGHLVALEQLLRQWPLGGHRVGGVQAPPHAGRAPEALRQRSGGGGRARGVEGRGAGGHEAVRAVAAGERRHHHRAQIPDRREQRIDDRIRPSHQVADGVQRAVHAYQVPVGQPQPAQVPGQAPGRHAPQEPVAQPVPAPPRAPRQQSLFELLQHAPSRSSSNASMKNLVAQLRTISRPYSPSTGHDPARPPRIAGSAEEMSWRAIR